MSALGRRALLGLTLLDRPSREREARPAPPPAPAPAKGGFSLDGFYAGRAASGGPGAMPSFSVKVTEEPVETSWRGCPELKPRDESPPPWAKAKAKEEGEDGHG